MVSNSFKESVKNKNIGEIRSIFFVIFSRRSSSKDITEYLDYCLSNGINKDSLFVDHDGELLLDDVKKWDANYYARQVGKIENNFSKERITLLMKMSDHLFTKKDQKQGKIEHKKKDNTLIYVAAGTIAVVIALIFFF
ncbi:hypothetical protein G6W42_07015 [Campylobacter concisus]|uniref:hypothetical protein n=1 Tax=Campylobacter concisus TaxID=199 RepID=UPI0018839D95|nr:hypothetical protein [Campylobacter concisus]MBE9852367.1 hypothetical protein [Campylobacter concisus]